MLACCDDVGESVRTDGPEGFVENSDTRMGGVEMKGEYWISSGMISRIVPGLSSANMLDSGDGRASRNLLGRACLCPCVLVLAV